MGQALTQDPDNETVEALEISDVAWVDVVVWHRVLATPD